MELFITRKTEKVLSFSKEISNEQNQEKWSLDSFLVDRKTCLIVTHKETLYTFFVCNIKKADLKNINDLVYNALIDQIKTDEIDLEKSIDYFNLKGDIQINFLRTDNDQKTLGWLRDILIVTKFVMEEDKSAKIEQLKSFAKYMNDRPIGKRNYKTPIELLRENF